MLTSFGCFGSGAILLRCGCVVSCLDGGSGRTSFGRGREAAGLGCEVPGLAPFESDSFLGCCFCDFFRAGLGKLCVCRSKPGKLEKLLDG